MKVRDPRLLGHKNHGSVSVFAPYVMLGLDRELGRLRSSASGVGGSGASDLIAAFANPSLVPMESVGTVRHHGQGWAFGAAASHDRTRRRCICYLRKCTRR